MGRREVSITSDAVVRFWRPAECSSTDFLCAYLEGGSAAPHIHEEWQFVVTEWPSGVSVGAFRRFSVDVGCVAVVAPYEVHTERGGTTSARRCRVLHVAGPVVAHLLEGIVGRPGYSTPRFESPVLTDPRAAAELRTLLWASESGAMRAEFVPLVSQWVRQLIARHRTERVLPATSRAVERTRVYLRDHPTQAVSLPEMVSVAGVTVSHLIRSFSRVVGLPPLAYHAQVRLARARRLLSEGKSVTWVAHECGFADQSHLSRRFKRSYGLTPGAFQAQSWAPAMAGPSGGAADVSNATAASHAA
jgi:AraC-like DNA-binding protein